jgi:hypothetical protein
MNLYKQSGNRRPSVNYVPVDYKVFKDNTKWF